MLFFPSAIHIETESDSVAEKNLNFSWNNAFMLQVHMHQH